MIKVTFTKKPHWFKAQVAGRQRYQEMTMYPNDVGKFGRFKERVFKHLREEHPEEKYYEPKKRKRVK